MSTHYASLLALALAFSGMAALAFAKDRHHEQLTGHRQLSAWRSRLLHGVGSLLLVASVAPCVMSRGASVGVVAWLGFISAGALLAVAGISYAPRGSARLAGVAGGAALLALALQAVVV